MERRAILWLFCAHPDHLRIGNNQAMSPPSSESTRRWNGRASALSRTTARATGGAHPYPGGAGASRHPLSRGQWRGLRGGAQAQTKKTLMRPFANRSRRTAERTRLALFPGLETAWRNVESSFERFCLTVGIGAVDGTQRDFARGMYLCRASGKLNWPRHGFLLRSHLER